MMKHVKYLSLLSLILLSSCADELYQSNSVPSNGKEIYFKTFSDKQLRASVATDATLTSFTVSGWSHPTGSVYDGFVLNGVTVTRGEQGGGTTWDYFPKASWPATGEVDFFAYTPASSVHVTAGLKQAPSVTTPPSVGPEIQYTVPGWVGGSRPVDQQEDFLVTKSEDLTFASNPIVHLNFKHALSRIVFKAQNRNKNKTYVIKELALSNLKSKGTLNMLDSVPDAGATFAHTPGQYNISWKAQSDSVTYKVDLGSTNVYVPYGTGTTGADYTAITSASNGLMVLPQATVLGAFINPSKEYGPVDSVAATPVDASYLYATVAEVDYLTNDTVNTRQVVFRLHDPADKAKGIVFEAGRQYTFLLTLGLDGGEIAFSVPSVTDFNTDAVVYAPWMCGHPLKVTTSGNQYWTGNFGVAGCWMTENLRELPTGVTTVNTAGNSFNTPYVSIPGASVTDAGGPSLPVGSITPELNDTIKKYGYLYSWNVAMGIPSGIASNTGSYGVINLNSPAQAQTQGICPSGWHLPSDYEWTLLEKEIAMAAAGTYSSLPASAYTDTVGMATANGYRVTNAPSLDKKMRASVRSWTAAGPYVVGSSNAASAGGFYALPAGRGSITGQENVGTTAYFFSSSSWTADWSCNRLLQNTSSGSWRSYGSKYLQYSVRCKKD